MRLAAASLLLVVSVTARSDESPSCGPAAAGRELRALHGEVAAGETYSARLAPGFGFHLEPVDAGWQLRVRDDNGLDLSSTTPPRFGPNPRDLLGWHFRDAQNSGPNDGSVNAPQRLRLFQFEPAWAGTAGVKAAPDAEQPDPSGRGWLYVQALGNDAFAAADQQARAVWLRFDACLSWPSNDVATTDSPRFSDEETEMIYDCGLPADWRPEAWLRPRWLGGDFDDDGALDHAVPVARGETRAIAICLAGERLHMIGPGGLQLGDDTRVAAIEAWRVENTPRGRPDELRLLRHEKSEHAVTAADGALQARTLFRLVTGEP